MDRFIAQYGVVPDGDLVLCPKAGVAYQRDMTVTCAYDMDYYMKCDSYEATDIGIVLNKGRVAFVRRYLPDDQPLLDIGVGSCEFLRYRNQAYQTGECDGTGVFDPSQNKIDEPSSFGYDVNPAAVEVLKSVEWYSDRLEDFKAFTMWDVIEHVPTPEDYLKRMVDGSELFVSIPVFEDLTKIRQSRHYRPGEHLYYWTREGFVRWMRQHSFRCREISSFETRAGRDSIESYSLIKDPSWTL